MRDYLEVLCRTFYHQLNWSRDGTNVVLSGTSRLFCMSLVNAHPWPPSLSFPAAAKPSVTIPCAVEDGLNYCYPRGKGFLHGRHRFIRNSFGTTAIQGHLTCCGLIQDGPKQQIKLGKVLLIPVLNTG